jgi:hypothetical protein
MYGNRSLKNRQHLSRQLILKNDNMAAVKIFSLAFGMMAISNEPLMLGM